VFGCKNGRQLDSQLRQMQRQDDPILGKQSTNLIADLRAIANRPAPNPMQRLAKSCCPVDFWGTNRISGHPTDSQKSPLHPEHRSFAPSHKASQTGAPSAGPHDRTIRSRVSSSVLLASPPGPPGTSEKSATWFRLKRFRNTARPLASAPCTRNIASL